MGFRDSSDTNTLQHLSQNSQYIKLLQFENKYCSKHSLTGLGLDSLRKDFKSPPAKSSKMINLGCFSKHTPMKWTMLGWLNLDMIKASIKKSISAWFVLSSGKVFTATAISSESLGVFLKNPWYTSPNAPWPIPLKNKKRKKVFLRGSFPSSVNAFSITNCASLGFARKKTSNS